ncbi:GFA family protein [Rhizobium ruizarguesonis]|uniref:GFA family protein n=1 Tax=Rhizobium ruizarguesonis TaxID=2081791 RepID=A0ABY1X7L4_9HYPH|nr:GFA family protein [Rhizobium ruizarguesonis]TAU60818.1 GFA family protein [Rhizobium ruizarguesonis]TAV20564.1 GFA family protein [Rhizobium ruizarguesonis]TAV25568.1 GFA family protein [Rhizobium ruizarguesonis]TAW49167.1 GFA family protein [Rhizobium ruizarguesonis]TAW82555.1 GFA family protein [Rhizobium ruizarguesonis]
MQTVVLTGGCQCGAVRYALEEPPQNVHICHCRMCQKAVGGPFAIICPVLKPAFRLTRGAISYFRSSDVGRRGFCRDCGTPLTFDYPDGDDIGVLVGTLDQPDRAPPENQYGNESRVSWYANLVQVPGERPTYADNPQMLHRISSTNHQHPDHDTDHWSLSG